MNLAACCWNRPSRKIACWLILLLPAATGCDKSMQVPNEPPPGVKPVTTSPLSAKLPSSSNDAEPMLHPRWLGTRVWTEREVAVDALRRVGPSALPALVELLHGPDRDLRELSARAIALMGPVAKAAVPDLEAALSDLDPAVRKNVIRALGQMGPDAESAIPTLVQEIHRPGPVVETTPGETGSPGNVAPTKRNAAP